MTVSETGRFIELPLLWRHSLFLELLRNLGSSNESCDSTFVFSNLRPILPPIKIDLVHDLLLVTRWMFISNHLHFIEIVIILHHLSPSNHILIILRRIRIKTLSRPTPQILIMNISLLSNIVTGVVNAPNVIICPDLLGNICDTINTSRRVLPHDQVLLDFLALARNHAHVQNCAANLDNARLVRLHY